MITQSINSKSKLADYKNYHNQAKVHIEELEAKLHNKEVDFLIRDLTVLFTTAKRQVVELFPIN